MTESPKRSSFSVPEKVPQKFLTSKGARCVREIWSNHSDIRMIVASLANMAGKKMLQHREREEE